MTKKTGILALGLIMSGLAQAETASASGGEGSVVYSDDCAYRVHTFRSDGTFTVTRPGKVDILLVGGGGGGGSGCGGGGGGGDVKILRGIELAVGDYPIVVGQGGAGGSGDYRQNGRAGGTTSLGAEYVAEGGGGGGGMYYDGDDAAIPGGGGGDPGGDNNPTSRKGGTSTYDLSIVGGQSYATHSHITNGDVLGGGGAGAGGSGVDAYVEGEWKGTGGPGVHCDFSGVDVAYGGGGGGGGNTQNGSGRDGGGNGGRYWDKLGKSGVANTGGGGGGGDSWSQTSGAGGNGGSGIVIVRYPFDPNVAFDTVTGGEITLVGEDEVHTFRENGQLSVSGGAFVEVLLVAGGGGGGSSNCGGGGGGGGGVIHRENLFLGDGTFDIIVGKGGKGGDSASQSAGENGGDTVAFGLTAIGGGGGGSSWDSWAKSGGSGGGGGYKYYTAQERVVGGAGGTEGQGFAGGASINYWYTEGTGGGGGGAGGPGYDGSRIFTPDSGRGGPGLPIAISGRTVYYGPGGAGGVVEYQSWQATMNRGGATGGGDGAGERRSSASYVGSPNVGAGGGGGYGVYNGGNTVPGGDGTDGIVIVRCRRQTRPNWKAASAATGGARVRRGEYYVHTFTADGTFVLPDRALVDLFIVGGGGGGGSGGGGGGGGSVVVLTNVVLEAGDYPVVIGAGGNGGSDSGSGASGSPTSFGAYCAFGGAGGGGKDKLGLHGAVPGGGAGSPGNDSWATWKAGGNAIGNTAVVGGRGYSPRTYWTDYNLGGGGAGAGGSGVDAYVEEEWKGTGGPGVVCTFLGSEIAYGGGGGGGGANVIGYGRDGGGDGGMNLDGPGESAAANTGGGGGGGGNWSQSWENCGTGGNGGSGIVLVRYKCVQRGFSILVR